MLQHDADVTLTKRIAKSIGAPSGSTHVNAGQNLSDSREFKPHLTRRRISRRLARINQHFDFMNLHRKTCFPRAHWLAVLTGLATLLIGCQQTHIAVSDGGFKPLFDGKSLEGWKVVNGKEGAYGVTNGILYCARGSGGNLMTEKEYENFVLRFEFKLEEGSNNGLGIRAPLEGDAAYLGMEIQILDEVAAEKGKWGRLKPEQFHGSIYDVVAAEKGALLPPGQWNAQEVVADGRQIKVTLNGKTILDVDINNIKDPIRIAKHPGLFRPRGHIGFLGHGDYVEFRNIRIKELPRTRPTEGFTSLFNGKDLTGWKGLVGDPKKRVAMTPQALAAAQEKADELAKLNWRVENGTLVYRGTNYDNLVTVKDYVNFELLVDWKIEPRADSGIYLRGTPQVQIWDPYTEPVKAGNEIGSGGLFNNKVNASKPLVVADKPIGEWNQFRIIMVGDKVHVFLNDQLVVNGTTLENYWQRDLPVLPFGPIELQAHTTVVWFKNIYVRELPTLPR